jgi:DNA-binding NarL/FixJ family response regulator
LTISCLVVDDQSMVREGFSALLDAQPDMRVVGHASNGAEAVAMSREHAPDIVLMDVRMPVMDGLEATRRILGEEAEAPVPRIIMLTTFDLDDYVYEALRAGASGFLLKDASADELVRAVRVVASGDALLAPSVTRRLIRDFTRQGGTLEVDDETLSFLTARELEVLRLVALGMSNAEISEALVIASQTTKSHVSRILAKLGLRDRAQIVVFAYESRLVVPGEAPERE